MEALRWASGLPFRGKWLASVESPSLQPQVSAASPTSSRSTRSSRQAALIRCPSGLRRSGFNEVEPLDIESQTHLFYIARA